MSGRPLVLTWADEHLPAIVQGWQLGTQTGNAIGEVLYGDYNPSGKLPMSFPRSVGQVPIYYNRYNTGRPGPIDLVFWAHYTDEENAPLYPFGYGLSYTDFEYSNIQVSNNWVADGKIKVSVDLTNSGSKPGKEVAQLYIRDMVGQVSRPIRELKGFELVELEAGETKKIDFELTSSELGYFLNDGEYVVDPGKFQIYVGGNSDATLMKEFTLPDEKTMSTQQP